MYIDVHCHLDYFKDAEINKVVKECRKKKVNCILTNGVDIKSNREVLEIAKKHREVKACLGIYPSEGLKMTGSAIMKEIEFIRENAEHISCIGEVGMDFKEGDKDKTEERQEELFREFISLAIELDIPVTVHSRKAEEECIKVLERLNAGKVIMHCFFGNMNLVKRIINNGWMLSIPASVKNSQHFQEVIRLAPIDQLFCETDSPFLHPDKRFPNTPANVVESYKMIAKIKGISLKDAEKRIEENFERLFG